MLSTYIEHLFEICFGTSRDSLFDIQDSFRSVSLLALVTSPDGRTTPQHIKHYSLKSISHSVVFPIFPGVVGLVAYVADGSKRHQPDTCRPLETGPWTRSSWTSDATAHAGCAMIMMWF